MTSIEHEVLDALRELNEAAAQGARSGPKPDFQGLFGRLDALTVRLEGPEHQKLRHFLERKSYEPARLYLEGVPEARCLCRR